jgi:hypothetical protein
MEHSGSSHYLKTKHLIKSDIHHHLKIDPYDKINHSGRHPEFTLCLLI